ncbi:MAG: hypothetical protein JO015_04115 [Verrucomicrobia bacterium]|nr:hypothetical protein [Verrucomicrobiota bacterium]
MWKAVLFLSICGLVSACAAPAVEALLVVTLSTRAASPVASSEDQVSPPDTALIPLGRTMFRLTSHSQDLEAGLDGVRGQQIIVRFTAVVLPPGFCAVANYEAFGLAKPEPGRPFGAGSTLQANPAGFSVEPGKQVTRMISADTGSGAVVYRLEFSVLKVFGARSGPVKPRLFEGW